MVTTRPRQIALVGAGPRGLSVLERLCANERAAPGPQKIVIHVIDPARPGAGQVWRSSQNRHLLMNTVASQVTVYTDDSVAISGPIEYGPSLHEWAGGLADRDDIEDPIKAEAEALTPDSYPTRAFYGRYLMDCFATIARSAPEHVEVREHRTRAVAMADTDGLQTGRQGLRLENGERLDNLDAIVLAQGHLPARLRANEARTASMSRIHRLTYIPPSNPADIDLGEIAPGETALVRGLGLNFFDYMAMLTVGRGGVFEDRAEGPVYLPSGLEPRIVAFSRRGVPYHSRGENQKGATGRYFPRLITEELITDLRARAGSGAPVRFGTEVWPLIAREVESVYYRLLVSRDGGDGDALADRFLAEPDDDARTRLLDDAGVAPALRWDWERLENPCAGTEFHGRTEFRRWLVDHLAEDVRQARAGNVDGPVKAALDVLRDLRNEVRLLVDHGGLDGSSYRDELQAWYTPLNAYLSIGPPVRRIEEMIALLHSGVLEVTGPGTTVRLDPSGPAFLATSDTVPGPVVSSRILVESRLPEPDLRRTEDPLLQHLISTGQCSAYRIPTGDGDTYETGGLAVTQRPYRLIDERGVAHPRRFALGVPTEAVHWVTAAGIRPGVDSVSLGDADAIARAVADLPALETVRSAEGAEPVGVIV
jgi:hypothetical protein